MRGKRPAFAAVGYLLPLTSYLLLTAACHGSAAREQQEVRRKLASWDATARLTRELEQRGALPRVYVRQVSEAVEQGKQESRKTAPKSSQ